MNDNIIYLAQKTVIVIGPLTTIRQMLHENKFIQKKKNTSKKYCCLSSISIQVELNQELEVKFDIFVPFSLFYKVKMLQCYKENSICEPCNIIGLLKAAPELSGNWKLSFVIL